MEDVSCRALIDASDNGDVKFDNLTSDYIDLKSKNGNIRGNINGAQTEYIITSNSKYGNNNLGSAVNSGKEIRDLTPKLTAEILL